MTTRELERLGLAIAEQQLARLDGVVRESQRRLKELNASGYFADEQSFEDALATVIHAHAQMRAHRRQVSNRLDELAGRPTLSRNTSSSFAYKDASNVRRPVNR